MIDPFDTKESGGAAFNTGLATAMEIRKLLNECNILSRRSMFVDWYNTLLTLNREICAEPKYESHKTKIEESIESTNKSMSAWMQKDSGNTSRDILQKLNDLEIDIRKAIKACGLGMPEKDDDDGL